MSMSSRSVLQSLRELFPQVDQRILWALSIEHADDINEAVEFILSEVLSSGSKEPQFSCIFADDEKSPRDDYVGKSLVHDGTEGAKGDEHSTVVDHKSTSSLGIPHHIGEAGCSGLDSGNVDGEIEHAILCHHQLSYEGSDECVNSELKPDASTDKGEFVLNINMSGEENGSMLFKNQSQDDNIEQPLDGDAGSFFQTEQHTSFYVGEDDLDTTSHSNDELLSQVNVEEMTSVEVDDQNTLSLVFDKSEPLEYRFEHEDDINISMNGSGELSSCSIEACRSLNLHDMESKNDALSAIAHSPILPDASDSGRICLNSESKEGKNATSYDNKNIENSDKNLLELMSCEVTNLKEDYNSLPTSLTTQSGHTLSIDVLECSVNDARSNKEILQSSIESIVIMMKEVELFEERAKHAKEEALVAGHDILSKVEELKLIVKRSKDENDMHAGEIYGERSILGTEARELQSRLLRISEKKSRYLLITEEISRSLEERFSSAKAEIFAAEVEKHEKEEHANKALREQEILRDDVFIESKILQQEADENSKLREFLMDRGRSVDSLQGEIAIICEDILSLKQKVDHRIPLSKSLPSSSRSFGGSSANSSVYRSSSSSPSILINKEVPEKNEQAENTSNEDNLLTELEKPSLDDWVELF